MSHTIQTVMAAVTSWVVGLLAMSGVYQDQILFWLGLVLVVARLVQELPKAYQKVRSWIK